jgi:hypothetical protein
MLRGEAMLRYFKDRKVALSESYQRGFLTAKNQTEKKYSEKVKRIKAEALKILEEKTKQIKERDAYIDRIEKTINDYMHIMEESSVLMREIEREKNIEMLELGHRAQSIQKYIDSVVSVARRSEKFSKVQNQIEQYNIKKLN